MIQLSNTEDVKLLPGEDLIFNRVVLHTGNAERFSFNSPTEIYLLPCGLYEISFVGNIFGGTPPLSIGLRINDHVLEVSSATTSSSDPVNVTCRDVVRTTMRHNSIKVTNLNNSEAITVMANSSIIIKRIG